MMALQPIFWAAFGNAVAQEPRSTESSSIGQSFSAHPHKKKPCKQFACSPKRWRMATDVSTGLRTYDIGPTFPQCCPQLQQGVCQNCTQVLQDQKQAMWPYGWGLAWHKACTLAPTCQMPWKECH